MTTYDDIGFNSAYSQILAIHYSVTPIERNGEMFNTSGREFGLVHGYIYSLSRNHGFCTASRKKIADDLTMSNRMVDEIVMEMSRAGWIVNESEGKRSRLRLTDKAGGIQADIDMLTDDGFLDESMSQRDKLLIYFRDDDNLRERLNTLKVGL